MAEQLHRVQRIGDPPITDADPLRVVRLRERRRRQPTCKHPGCGTVLSIYNAGDFCYQHEPTTIMRRGGQKLRPVPDTEYAE